MMKRNSSGRRHRLEGLGFVGKTVIPGSRGSKALPQGVGNIPVPTLLSGLIRVRKGAGVEQKALIKSYQVSMGYQKSFQTPSNRIRSMQPNPRVKAQLEDNLAFPIPL
jgi:hypothetical protein